MANFWPECKSTSWLWVQKAARICQLFAWMCRWNDVCDYVAWNLTQSRWRLWQWWHCKWNIKYLLWSWTACWLSQSYTDRGRLFSCCFWPQNDIAYHTGSHSVTCGGDFPTFTPAQAATRLATLEGCKAEFWWSLYLKIVYQSKPVTCQYLREPTTASYPQTVKPLYFIASYLYRKCCNDSICLLHVFLAVVLTLRASTALTCVCGLLLIVLYLHATTHDMSLLGRVSPKLSQLGRQLTERQLDNKLNSSFRFTNIRHVKSVRSESADRRPHVLIG